MALSWGHVAGHQGALEALEDLSANQKEEDEEGQHHSRVEALGEGVLSYLEVQVGLGKRERKHHNVIRCAKSHEPVNLFLVHFTKAAFVN